MEAAIFMRTKLRKRTYTKEEARTIVAGLLQGARKRKPMSDAEYFAIADPKGHYEAQVVEALKTISGYLERLTSQDFIPSPPPQHRPTPPPPPQSGPGAIDL